MKKLLYLYPVAQVLLSILGARSQLFPLEAITIGLACLVPFLVYLKDKPKSFNSVLLYSTSLSLIFQTSMVSNYLIGTDLHGEFFYSYIAYNNGWDWRLPYEYNTSVWIGFIAPQLSKLTHLNLYWVYKIVPSITFAAVPTVCYWTFKNYFEDFKAFLSALFVITVPSYI